MQMSNLLLQSCDVVLYVSKWYRINSFDDFLVGAPMYSKTRYEEGAVYVYMNNKDVTYI